MLRRFLCSALVFFFKQKTAYEMRISDWSSDVCSSDLFYGMQTLLQLLPASVFGSDADADADGGDWSIPCVEITDVPRFRWRGMHLDEIGTASCRERVCQYV